ncbi:MAG: DUF3343 domain-containing protein [Ruminococcaceae bacterium]|jgi:hypothetical protein|nr:DUF3343 domain-containing protein [Oscillospiraceae bacterium]
MRERTMHVVVTFHTTAEAMATEKVCRARELAGKLISAPRALSADCGIAWSAPAGARSAIEEALAEAGIETAGVHELLL